MIHKIGIREWLARKLLNFAIIVLLPRTTFMFDLEGRWSFKREPTEGDGFDWSHHNQ